MATYRAVVTGASSGIGRATAMLLAKDGHALVLTARREKELVTLADVCLAGGASAVSVVPGDVASEDTAKMIADAVKQSGEGEVVLVNNAGSARFGAFHEQSIDTAVDVIESNLIGALVTTRALLPLMLRQGKGTIVNVLSVAAVETFPGAEAYCAAKAGLHAFTKCLAIDYRRQGVRVTSVLPGATDTPLWDDVEGHPEREDMLSAKVVAETIKHVIDLPRDRSIDELVIRPPKGTL